MRKKSSLSLVLSCLFLSLGCAFGQYGQVPSAPQQVSVPQTTAASIEPAIDCAGHADGLYVRNPNECNDGFYKCANDRSFYYRCPTGLFFSIEDAQCEYRQLIPACGGQRPVEVTTPSQPVSRVQVYQPTTQAPVYQTPPAPVAVQPTTTQAPYVQPTTQAPVYNQPTYQQPQQVPIAVVSSVPSPQSTYQQPQAPVLPASQPTYQSQPQSAPSFQISYGQQVPIAVIVPSQTPQPAYQQSAQAPQPTYQQPAQAPQSTYQQPAQAPVAPQQQSYQSYQQPAQTPVAPQQQSYQSYQQPAQAPQLVASTRPPVNFNCGTNPDGYYTKQACRDTVYYSCVGGIASQLTCTPGTVYDPINKICDYPAECGKPKTTTTKPMFNYGYGWQHPTTAKPSTLCNSRQDGFYAMGHCVKDYLHCSNGQAFELKCPSGLVFRNDSCTYLSDCVFPTTAAPQLAVQTAPTPPPLTWCRDHQKQTGFYSQGCSTKFFHCNSGFTSEMSCPASLVYDQSIQQCEERQFVVLCGGRPRPPTTTTIATPRAPVIRPNFNCAGKQDGFYSNGCSGTYFVCNGAIATDQLRCPGQLVFDQTQSACEERQFAVSCGGRPRPPTTPATPRLVAKSTFNCQSLSDGYYYRSGCVSTYHFCNGGTALDLTCPNGLSYSPTIHSCDYKSNIPECGGQLPTTTVQPPAPVAVGNQMGSGKQYGYAPQSQAPQAYQTTTQAPVYQTPPAPVAVQPTTTQAPYVQPTTQAPVYNQPTYQQPAQPQAPIAPQQQSYQSYEQPAQPQAPVAPQQQSYQSYEQPAQPQAPIAPQQQSYQSYQQPAQAPVAVAQPDQMDNTNQCAHLQNGIYGSRCSRFYFVCTDHKIFEFTCPSGFAYDRTIARCGPVDKIQGCSSTQLQQAPSGSFRIRK